MKSSSIRKLALLGLPTVLAITACRLLIGNLDECQSTADCGAKGFGLVCQQSLCVTDPRCTTFGQPSPNAFVLGVILPKTVAGTPGSLEQGVLAEDAVRLVVTELNNAGGVATRPVAVISCDDAQSATTAEELAAQMVDQGALAIVTAGTTETLAESAVTIPAGVPIVAGWATSIQIQSAGTPSNGVPKLVWSTATPDNIQGAVMANLLVQHGVQSPAVIARNDAYGSGLADSISHSYQSDTDGGAVAVALYTAGGDPTAAVNQIEPLHSSGVVLVGLPAEADAILSAWTVPDPSTWFFTDACESPQVLTGIPNGASRLVGHSLGTGPAAGGNTQAYTDFSAQFESAYGVNPESVSFVDTTYDAAMVVVVGAAWAFVNASGPIGGADVAEGFSHIEAPLPEGGVPIPLEPDYITTIVSDFVQHQDVKIQGASGNLDFDPATGVAPGPIGIWDFSGADGGSVNLIDNVPAP